MAQVPVSERLWEGLDVDFLAVLFQVRAPPHRSPSGVRGLFEREEAFLKWRVMDRLNPSGAFRAGVSRQLINKDPPGEGGPGEQLPSRSPEASRPRRSGGGPRQVETPCLDRRLQAASCGRCRVIYWGGGQQKGWWAPSTRVSGTQANLGCVQLLAAPTQRPAVLCFPWYRFLLEALTKNLTPLLNREG